MSDVREAPSRIEREAVLAVDIDTAWEAISDASMLELWLADEVELVPVEGTPATFTVDGDERPGRVERVEEGRGLCFTWEREAGRQSIVELHLTPCVSGTRLEVSETDLGFDARMAAASWTSAISRLVSLHVHAYA